MNILNLGNLNIKQNCDECENSFAQIHCQQCEQYMCEDCDLKIHNKGRRAQHMRRTLCDGHKQEIVPVNLIEKNENSEFILKNLIQNDISRYLESEQSSQDIHSSQKKNYCEGNSSKVAPNLSSAQNTSLTMHEKSEQKFIFKISQPLDWETGIQQVKPQTYLFLSYVKQQTQKGNIVYNQEQFLQLLTENRLNQTLGAEIVNETILKEWVLLTTRLFNDRQQNFYSLNIRQITYESLCWVVLSIKRDLITPTERLVLSRIKECFGIKLSKNEWSQIVHMINCTKKAIKVHTPNGSNFQQYMLPLLCVKMTKDPLINEQMTGIYIADQPWPVEDELIEGLDKLPQWQYFIKFLDDYFASEQQKSRVLTGGRYGSAQYIKIFGPKELKQCSLGRLTSFVQLAVNKGFIKYNRTILIKNQNQESFQEPPHDSNQQGKSQQLVAAQKALIELLVENPDGVQLAQIPQMLKPNNLNDLGFPKLKNFLETMKDLVQIENYGKNNCVAKLITGKLNIQSPQLQPQKRQFYQGNGSDRSHYKQYLNRNTDEYLRGILLNIHCIVHQNCYGISINNLFNQLSTVLGGWFQFEQFGCTTFLQFLQNYAEQMIVIVCQKHEYRIYERDYRFRPPPEQPTSKSMYSQTSQTSERLSENQFEQMLNDAFPNQFQIPSNRNTLLNETYSNASWLERQEIPLTNSRIIRWPQNPLPEDSNLDICENLRFIEELLGGRETPTAPEHIQFTVPLNNETEQTIQDWSVSLNQQIGMISSINLGERGMKHSKTHSEDFDLTKALEERERRHTHYERPTKR